MVSDDRDTGDEHQARRPGGVRAEVAQRRLEQHAAAWERLAVLTAPGYHPADLALEITSGEKALLLALMIWAEGGR